MIQLNEIRCNNYYDRTESMNEAKLGFIKWTPQDWCNINL